jgi:predicted deacylase
VVTAGVHGDEYEGVRTIFDIVDELDPGAMSGDLLCVPVANPPAYWAGTRISPVDGKNLARVFPGAPDGTISDQIAFCLGREVIAADSSDLHAGVKIETPTLIGYDSEDSRAQQAQRFWRADFVGLAV